MNIISMQSLCSNILSNNLYDVATHKYYTSTSIKHHFPSFLYCRVLRAKFFLAFCLTTSIAYKSNKNNKNRRSSLHLSDIM